MSSPTTAATPHADDVASEKRIPHFRSDFLLGTSVAAVRKTLSAPIERIKILFAVQRGKEEPYKGWSDCAKRVYAEKGVTEFFRGNGKNCLRFAPQLGCVLACNDHILYHYPSFRQDAQQHFWQSLGTKMLAGGIGGGVGATIVYPFYLAQQRSSHEVRSANSQFKGIADCMVKSVKSEGFFTGLFSGWSYTVLGAFAFRACQLGFFKQLQDLNPYAKDKSATGVATTTAAITVAKNVSVPFYYPFETMRRRMMLESGKPLADRTYKGAIHCFTTLVKQEGILYGLYGRHGGWRYEFGLRGTLIIVAYDRIKLIYNL